MPHELTVSAENPIERAVLALGLAPVTLMDTHMSFMRARAIMVATKLGIFDALASGALPATEVAERCATAPAATAKLLNALVGSGYLTFARGAYGLSAVARKWLIARSPHSVRDKATARGRSVGTAQRAARSPPCRERRPICD